MEAAKHRLVYSLLRLGLPLLSKDQQAETGLAFDFLADQEKTVLTGHAQGLITLNIAEADDAERAKRRQAMGEPYRTLLGHFRHEVGHYYWDRLIANTNFLSAYRQLFGDEQQDYGEALKLHYQQGVPDDWAKQYISTYASAHSWEDWAETWAHYLHLIDTLETAHAFSLRVAPKVAQEDDSLSANIDRDPYTLKNFDEIIALWLPLTFAMNSINRSMGQPDLYPFVIPPPVIEKLRFVHQVCHAWR
ncbi:zinc-binding metallopeptidase family protein [Catalinimonas niigatensis]|uniref:zinc-binding metallopeptidase family protein n=1 Tax=Catalinimonas niigatensis TaxID=1397264 RepID=UPI002666D07A|nr:putative zinc-binding metallopeptidase [Catalinimonas niigatensis]WPP50076.1 putative zinc-binding metallopeptidase [Catalinimonas niigatensis]